MTDFDSRLRDKFIRLDAAMPEPAPPTPAAQRRRPNRRRQAMFLLAAAVVFLGAAAVATVAQPRPPTAAEIAASAKDAADEERLRDDLAPLTDSACLTAAQAADLVAARLSALGIVGWTVRSDNRISQAPCVTVAPSGDTHEVLLIASMGGPVAHALDALENDLMAACASRDDAVGRLRGALVANGIADPRVEAGGIRGVPVGDGGAYVAHVQAGCHVLAGAQFDDVGRYTWFVAGP
jgi:hypothetical protein